MECPHVFWKCVVFPLPKPAYSKWDDEMWGIVALNGIFRVLFFPSLKRHLERWVADNSFPWKWSSSVTCMFAICSKDQTRNIVYPCIITVASLRDQNSHARNVILFPPRLARLCPIPKMRGNMVNPPSYQVSKDHEGQRKKRGEETQPFYYHPSQ